MMPTASILMLAATPQAGSLAGVPVAVHLPVVVVLVAGLILCAAGAKLLRPVYLMMVAAACSLLVGLLAPNFIADRLLGLPSPVIGMAVGAVLGTLLALATFRFALGLTTCGAFIIAAFLSAAAYLSTIPGAIPPLAEHGERLGTAWSERIEEAPQAYAMTQARRLIAVAASTLAATPADSTREDEVAANTRGFVDDCFHAFHEAWASLPGDTRLTFIATCLAGAMLGFALGVAAPAKAGAAITSLAGAMLVLLSGAWLLHVAGVIEPTLAERGALGWLAAWIGLALIALVFQWPKKSPPKGETAEA
ncbi:MAG: hypothetical protein RL689_839 [Planctomycetota bacterium]|jgi:hypothetical protein